MTSNQEAAPPVVCTLSEKDKNSQILEWHDLAPLTVNTKRLANGVVLEFEPGLAGRVVDLAQRESGCCGTWVSISTEVSKEAVRLEATTGSDEGIKILHGMLGLDKW